MKVQRSAWGNFPEVITNGKMGELKNEPEYEKAKAGDFISAGILINRLIRLETVEKIAEIIGDKNPIVVAVVAEEQRGANAIPYAIAQVIARELGLTVDTEIRQINKVSRTGKGINHRFAFQPLFGGNVQKGRDYFIVDDTLSVGGTIANLRGYIENNGANVIGAMVMTAYENALKLPISSKMLENIERKHGQSMNDFWLEEFGYGIDKLTIGEAGHLRAAENVEQIRARIFDAKNEAGIGISESGLSKPYISNKQEESAEEKLISELTVLLREKHHPKAILKNELPVAPCRGVVVYEGEDFIIQQVATDSRYFQLHKKENLSRIPKVGEKPSIRYSSKEKLAKVGEVNKKKLSL